MFSVEEASKQTKITILTATETIHGQNLCCAFFSANDLGWVRRPCLTRMIKGGRCTLAQKYNDFTRAGVDSNKVEMYGMLRYFLWFLITGDWCIKILRQEQTKTFLRKLKSSEYSVWVKTFTSGELKGYDKYFVG